MDELSKVLPKLKVLYAMSALRIDPWLSDLRILADESMNNGIYCELFRMVLYDRKIEPEDAHFSLASTVKELDPSNALPDSEECHLLYIKSQIQGIVIDQENAIDIAGEIIFGNYGLFTRDFDHENDYSFLNLQKVTSIYLRWYSYDSHAFVDKELKARRCKVLSELQTAATEWLDKLRPGL